MMKMRFETVVVLAALLLGGCATTSDGGGPAPQSAAQGGGSAGTMAYGGGDGTSCEQAVIIHASKEMTGIRAEYAWLALKYPGYRRGMQSLTKCNGRPADELQIHTADGRELNVYFDISEYFGHM